MTPVQRYVLLRLLQGWKAVSDGRGAIIYSPDRSLYREVSGRTIKPLLDNNWIESGDRKHNKSYWVVTQSGEQALNGKNR